MAMRCLCEPSNTKLEEMEKRYWNRLGYVARVYGHVSDGE